MFFPRFDDDIATMAEKAVRTHGRRECAVEVASSEVDVGTELSVTAWVRCPERCNLSGQRVSIRDRDGAEVASAELTEFDGEAYVTRALVLPAPLAVGEHVYQAVLAVDAKDGVLHAETATEFAFAAKAHAASVNVWGLPSAIAAGERFRFNVGIKCSAGCKLTGRPFVIFGDEGAQVGAGSLGDIWPDTSALYFAEVEAQAPLATGDHQWQIKTDGSDSSVPHADGSLIFTVKVVSPPDHEVTVAVFDSETQTPIEGAHVLLHPYRALTDKSGVAKVKVARGRYTLVVSGYNYIAHETIVDVASDVTTRAELAAEPEGQDDYR